MELQLLGKCESISTNGVDDMVFNPNYEIPALVVSYTDGRLNVFDYTTLKLDSSRPDVYANTLSCSKDGRSLVCGTSQGTIHVYKFDQGYAGNIVLVPIYRINSAEDAIRGVAFHFDGLRFVDITRRQCRVWEPTALVRRDNEVESTSDIVSLPHRTAGAVIASDKPHISTPLVTSKDGGFIAGGNTRGEIILFSADDGSELGPVFSHSQGASITLVALADSGGVMASADDSGRVVVGELRRCLHADGGETMAQDRAVLIILDKQLGRVVTQLLFSPEANRLLIVSSKTTELWEIPQGVLLQRQRLSVEHTSTGPEVKPSLFTSPSIIQHPSKPTSFIVMTGRGCRIFNWDDFGELTTPDGVRLLHPTHLHNSTSGTGIYHPISGVGVLEHTLPSQSSVAQLTLWPTAVFDEESDLPRQPLEDRGLGALGSIVHSVLGVVGGTRVIFLDINLWICSYDLRLSHTARVGSRSRSPGSSSSRTRTPAPDQDGNSNIRRHFFAMSEWRDGSNKFNSLMVPSARSSRNSGHDFAFVAGHRVVLVKGGLDFSETVTWGPTERASRSEEAGWSVKTGGALTKSPSSQQWTVVSGSMHQRSSNC